MTAADRKRAERARKRAAGWTRFECWIRPEWRARIVKLLQRLEKK